MQKSSVLISTVSSSCCLAVVLVFFLGGCWNAAEVDAQKEIFEKALDNMRYFEKSGQIEEFSNLCRDPLTDFGKCLAGNRKPKERLGKRMTRKLKRTVDAIMGSSEGQKIQKLQRKVKKCYDKGTGCAINPVAAIKCVLTNFFRGPPYDRIADCMKGDFGTPNLDLTLPDLGDLGELTERLEFLASIGLYLKYKESPSDFWAKFRPKILAICPQGNAQEVEDCITDELDSTPNLELDLEAMSGGEYSITVKVNVLGNEDLDKLTIFGPMKNLKFLQDMVTTSVMACGLDLLKFEFRGRTVCFSPAKLASKNPCAHLFYVPRCLHYAMTLVKGVCGCRNNLLRDGNIDPFQDSIGFLNQAQTEFIEQVTDKYNQFKRFCDLGSKKCRRCRDFGRIMNINDVTLTEGFEEEIDVVMDLLEKVCDFTGNMQPFRKECDANRQFRNRKQAKIYKRYGVTGSKGLRKHMIDTGKIKPCRDD